MLGGGETVGGCSSDKSGAFLTFNPTTDEQTGTVTMEQADEYRVFTGVPTDGNSPYDQFCAHWFDTHPTYADGGLVAMGWYDHGTRFLDVAAETGESTEKGGSTRSGWLHLGRLLDHRRDHLRRGLPAQGGHVSATSE